MDIQLSGTGKGLLRQEDRDEGEDFPDLRVTYLILPAWELRQECLRLEPPT